MDKTDPKNVGNPYQRVNILLDRWQIDEMKKRCLNRSALIRSLLNGYLRGEQHGQQTETIL